MILSHIPVEFQPNFRNSSTLVDGNVTNSLYQGVGWKENRSDNFRPSTQCCCRCQRVRPLILQQPPCSPFVMAAHPSCLIFPSIDIQDSLCVGIQWLLSFGTWEP